MFANTFYKRVAIDLITPYMEEWFLTSSLYKNDACAVSTARDKFSCLTRLGQQLVAIL
jgi:hypothetical protein